MRIPEARAAAGRASPSSQLAWCGSPQAICTTLIPSRSRKRFSSGILLTWRLQLQTPRVSGARGLVADGVGCTGTDFEPRDVTLWENEIRGAIKHDLRS